MKVYTESIKSQTRLQETCSNLSRLARQRGAGAKLPTVVQLRETFGVGVNTLNDALAQLEELNIITRRQGSGIFVSPTLPRIIALICDPTILQGTAISPVWQMMLQHARVRAEEEGECLEFHMANPWTHSEPFNSDFLRKLEDHEVNGIIGIGLTEDAVKCIKKLAIPFVGYAGPGDYTVAADTGRALELGYAELMSRGCQRIGIWNSALPGRPVISAERHLEEFRFAVEACGGHFQPELIWDAHAVMPSPTLTPQEQGFEVATEHFSTNSERRLDGLYISDDMMTHGALIALDQLNIKVGSDLLLASHVNRGSGILQGRTNLILLEHDPAAIVEALFDTIERLMSGLDVPNPRIKVLPTLRIT